jgi:hypothetical protein
MAGSNHHQPDMPPLVGHGSIDMDRVRREGQDDHSDDDSVEDDYEDVSEDVSSAYEVQPATRPYQIYSDQHASRNELGASMEQSFSVFALFEQGGAVGGDANANTNKNANTNTSPAMQPVTEEHGKGEDDDSDYNPDEDENESISLSYDGEDESLDMAEEQEKHVRRTLLFAFLSAIGVIALGVLISRLIGKCFKKSNDDAVGDLVAEEAGDTAGDAAGAMMQQGAMDASHAALQQSTSNLGGFVYVPGGEAAAP